MPRQRANSNKINVKITKKPPPKSGVTIAVASQKLANALQLPLEERLLYATFLREKRIINEERFNVYTKPNLTAEDLAPRPKKPPVPETSAEDQFYMGNLAPIGMIMGQSLTGKAVAVTPAAPEPAPAAETTPGLETLIPAPVVPAVDSSKYELSLAEFPVFLVSKKLPADLTSINYTDTIYPEGVPTERHWKVTWAQEYGPPTQSASETFFELYQIWKEEGFRSEWIYFKSIYALLKRRGISKGKRTYDQITKDLNCLASINIIAKNAFYDSSKKKYIDGAFHLFEEVILEKDTPNRPDGKTSGYIRASRHLLNSVQINSFLFGIPEKEYYKLPGLQQRLCQYLKKMFLVYPEGISRKIRDLINQIPLHCEQRQAKHQILKAAEEIIAAKIIPSFIKVRMQSPNTIRFETFVEAEQTELFSDKDLAKTANTKDRAAIQKEQAEESYYEISKFCTDIKKSERFYRLVAARMSVHDVRKAISETKEYERTSEKAVNRNRVFTSRVLDIADQRGISLKAKTAAKAKPV